MVREWCWEEIRLGVGFDPSGSPVQVLMFRRERPGYFLVGVSVPVFGERIDPEKAQPVFGTEIPGWDTASPIWQTWGWVGEVTAALAGAVAEFIEFIDGRYAPSIYGRVTFDLRLWARHYRFSAEDKPRILALVEKMEARVVDYYLALRLPAELACRSA